MVRPPTYLWASTVLWAPEFTVPSKHGETPHMPLGINSVCSYQHLPHPKQDDVTSHMHLTSNSVVGAYHHPIPVGMGNKAQKHTYSPPLSLVRPSPSSIKRDALSQNKGDQSKKHRELQGLSDNKSHKHSEHRQLSKRGLELFKQPTIDSPSVSFRHSKAT